MKAYLSIKFHEDSKNKELIEGLCSILSKSCFDVFCFPKDMEKYGEKKFEAKELMKLTFKEIDKSDIVIVELSEKGVGIGIEAGYAYAKAKPIIVIAKTGSDISKTLIGITDKVILYDNFKDLEKKLKEVKK